MPRIRLILEDDQGNPLCAEAQRVYELEGSLQTLDEIEEATETFKREALPEIEHSLLGQAQERFLANARGGEKQDPPLRRNGKEHLQLQTLHGSFTFACQRLSAAGSSAGHYLDHIGQEPVSRGLREFCLYFSGRLSFAEVAKLLERLTGQRLVCQQTLCNWVGRQAGHIEQSLGTEVDALRSCAGELAAPEIAEQVEIYDREAREILVMTDAIGVKAQRPTRERRTGGEPRPEKKLTDFPHPPVKKRIIIASERESAFFRAFRGSNGP